MNLPHLPLGRVYGRRRGRALRPAQADALCRLLPPLRINLDALPEEKPLDPFALFKNTPNQLLLEVGFGAGETLVQLARSNPRTGFIGCEAYRHGLARCLRAIDQANIANVRLFEGDARLLLSRLAPACFSQILLLFPDPWPKRRHHKRRFVQNRTLDHLARLLAPNGLLRIATDSPPCAAWILARLAERDDFLWTAQRSCDWINRPQDIPPSRYETKARAASRAPVWLSFRRRQSAKQNGA